LLAVDDLLTVVILAGGKGSRLNDQDKGLLQWQGKPFVEHILHNIASNVHHVLINANRNIETYQRYGHPVIQDDVMNYSGPLAGMLSALRVATTQYILTVPCDAPLTTQVVIERFLQAYGNREQRLYVAATDDGLQPVYAMIHTSLLGSLEKYLADGKRKTQGWLKDNHAVVVDFSEQDMSFMNINTEKEFQSIC
jgi:molybdenum cofactor guanylyltransferase